MIDNYLLEELVAFEKFGTLAATAKHLHVTQPTVTRGMQKLEEELGVTLFNRKPNRISLTETGQFTAQQAKRILQAQKEFLTQVQTFDSSRTKTIIASVAPGPLLLLNQLPESSTIQPLETFLDPNVMEEALLTHQVTLAISNRELETDQLSSIYLGTEHLSVNVDRMTLPSITEEVSFCDLANLSFVVLSNIGVWKDIIQTEIPDATFLYQNESDNFSLILDHSSFPYFVTNLSTGASHHPKDTRRTTLKIRDEAAQLDFYATYRKEDKASLLPLITALQNSWRYED
ncbi:LysR family transcriptional regulator [Streptococcus rifensis]